MAKKFVEPKPERPAEVVWTFRAGDGLDEWLTAKMEKYERERGRKVTQSEFVRAHLEAEMLDERRRQKAAL